MLLDISKYNLPKFRQKQLDEGIFKDLVQSFDDITTLPTDLREKLKKDFVFPSIQSVQEDSSSEVLKNIFQTQDGKFFEGVLILHRKKRQTVCVSSQVGCPVGCKFCATGMLGFERNLDYKEIVEHVLHYARVLKKKGMGISNIVFMGMGEPFLNKENVEKSIGVLIREDGFNMSSRKITVSTVWPNNDVVDFVKKYPQVNLAISLHSANEEKRQELVPIAQKVKLDDIKKGIKDCIEISNRRITLEYLLLENVNDSFEDAKELCNFVKEVNQKLLHVNLLSYNEVSNVYKPSSRKRTLEFQKVLEEENVKVTLRKSMGQEIGSACGMLKRDFN